MIFLWLLKNNFISLQIQKLYITLIIRVLDWTLQTLQTLQVHSAKMMVFLLEGCLKVLLPSVVSTVYGQQSTVGLALLVCLSLTEFFLPLTEGTELTDFFLFSFWFARFMPCIKLTLRIPQIFTRYARYFFRSRIFFLPHTELTEFTDFYSLRSLFF